MAAPLNTSKQTVDLTAPAVRGSRIRRNPPPPQVKELTPHEIRERDKRRAIAGILAFALSLSVLTLAVARYWGWSMGSYTVRMD